MSICIVDYGIGNIHSAMKGIKRFTNDVILTEKAADIDRATALILPGQGAFAAGMDGLRQRGLLEAVRNAAKRNIPILGICLGAQLLLEKGHEFGEYEGLGFLPGEVVHFPMLSDDAKIPHMGWNSLQTNDAVQWESTILAGLPQEANMYFIHSYILQPQKKEHILAQTTYGGLTFPSVIGRDTIYGCQFHPEKSGSEGLKIIENFVQLVEGAHAVL